ncbi:MAG: hypothetical protein IH840_15175 [Candidatus Heimdallarchaeota archaeon]|nr:hypothetical protein [Candidatus Heimdallarchaeota archaeon]
MDQLIIEKLIRAGEFQEAQTKIINQDGSEAVFEYLMLRAKIYVLESNHKGGLIAVNQALDLVKKDNDKAKQLRALMIKSEIMSYHSPDQAWETFKHVDEIINEITFSKISLVDLTEYYHVRAAILIGLREFNDARDNLSNLLIIVEKLNDN